MKIKLAALTGLALLTLTACVPLPNMSAGDRDMTPETAAVEEPVAEPAAEVEDTPTPEPEPVAEEGTRSNPFPAGTALVSNNWEGVIGATNLNANDVVAAANQFNDPAPEGFVYIAIPVEATYTGTEDANSMEIRVEYVTASGEVVDQGTSSTYVSADDSNPYQDLYEGGTVSFTEYLLVPAEGVENGMIRATFGFFNGAEGFVTLS